MLLKTFEYLKLMKAFNFIKTLTCFKKCLNQCSLGSALIQYILIHGVENSKQMLQSRYHNSNNKFETSNRTCAHVPRDICCQLDIHML